MDLAELTKIYRSELSKQIWSVSYNNVLARLFTNGHIVVVDPISVASVFKGDDHPLPAKWATSVPNLVGLVRTLLDQHGKPVTHDALAKFTAGTTWRPTECDDCEGTGAGALRRCKTCGDEHVCACPSCKDGLIFPTSRSGSVDATDGSGRSTAFDRNYVGLLLEVLPTTPQYTYAADDFLFALAPDHESRVFAALSRSAAEPSVGDPRLRAMEALAS